MRVLVRRLVGVWAVGALLFGAGGGRADEAPTLWTADDVRWTDVAGVAGARQALLWGDPKTGEHGTLNRWKFNTKLPARASLHDVRIVVLTGTFTVEAEGIGYREFGPGAVVILPRGLKHTLGCEASGECNFVMHQPGPADAAKPASRAASRTERPAPRARFRIAFRRSRMRSLGLSFVLLSSLASPALAQSPSLEDELRAEIVRLRESLARAEAVLARVEKERPATAPSVSAVPPIAPAPASEAQVAEAKPAPPSPVRRAPALNTPPKLPVSDPENYKKTPPRIDVLLQGRYDYFVDSDLAVDNTFFLRKAEVGFKANITKHVDFSLELDPIRVQLNDPYRRTYIRLSHLKHAHFKIGMEKAPLGLEELQPTAQIPFVDRSEVTGRFAAAEEMGVFLESNSTQFMFQASLTNGGRRLYVDNNRNKAFTARAVWAPVPSFSIGAATMQAKVGAESIDRKRYNVEAKYGADNQTGAQGEFYRAKEGPVWNTAFYVEGYWAVPLKAKVLTHVQPVARYEFIDRSDENPTLELRLVTVGVGLLFKEYKSKLQLNWLKDVRSDSPRPDELRAQYSIEF